MTEFVVISRITNRWTPSGEKLQLRQYRKLLIESTIVWENYQANSVHRNDIALLKLSSSVSQKRAVQLQLDCNKSEENNLCNKTALFYGYGQTFEGDERHNEFWKRRLQVMSTKVVNGCCNYKSQCYSAHTIDDFLITKAAARKTTYYGDSGGALIGPEGKQIGIATGLGVLKGTKNGQRMVNFDNYFVKISNHVSFLKRFLNKID